MKKFFPAILISLMFTTLMVSQMLINGQELSASKIEKNKERFTIYENQFSKLTVKTTQGSKVKLSKLHEPIVIVNFWASWCRPCITEFKSLNKLIKKFEGKVFVLGINNDSENPLKAIKKIEKEYSLKFESVKDTEGDVASKFSITKIPSSIIYHKGKVIQFSGNEYDFMNDDFIKLIENKIQ